MTRIQVLDVSASAQASPSLAEERFARFAKVEWWRQQKLRDACIVIAGAGALGNEVIKNLALLGVGNLLIADMDMGGDAGTSRAECAARSARELYPAMNVRAMTANITADLGLGWIRWADIVVGALDNRKARLFLNSACARLGRPWIDGAIETTQGVVRGFDPPRTSCYECTLSEAGWRVVPERRSYSRLARRALARGGVPAGPIMTSVIGAIQSKEVVKYLHDLPALLGSGFLYDGATHHSYGITYPIHPGCPWHKGAPPVGALTDCDSSTPLDRLWAYAEEGLGGCDALEFGREVVESLQCRGCGRTRVVLQPADRVSEDDARCTACGADSAPQFLHAIERGSEYLSRTPRELGLPEWDVVWARRGAQFLGLELAGDAPGRR